ncbi:hypothetical protein NE236_26700 [Actinoallomurus purpureus]|uniref:hypothetical protein n=1 Tax=Actinoallomurus purpureus TaxID=478114 RepID=UPI0020928B90|nr:hypothetical protein [Actinoallomurus purpureus]MCO6008568.1 hypothetical protein [Actinoallomurus purpureus]
MTVRNGSETGVAVSAQADAGGVPAARPGRVCLLIGQLGLGGTEKQRVLLADGLRARGVDTSVLVMFGGRST